MTRKKIARLISRLLFSAIIFAALFGGPILLVILGDRFAH